LGTTVLVYNYISKIILKTDLFIMYAAKGKITIYSLQWLNKPDVNRIYNVIIILKKIYLVTWILAALESLESLFI